MYSTRKRCCRHEGSESTVDVWASFGQSALWPTPAAAVAVLRAERKILNAVTVAAISDQPSTGNVPLAESS